MSAPFDQDLYSQIINRGPDNVPESYAEGWRDAADIAAQISAERQATGPTSDEALYDLWVRAYDESSGGLTMRTRVHQDPDVLAGIRAVRQALRAWPQVPPDEALVGKSIATIRKTLDYIRNDELKPGHVVRSSTTLRTCPADMDRIERELARIESRIDQIGGAE